MSRPHRIQEIGYYHLICRGVEKRKVYLDDDDHHEFLSLIDETKILHHFIIHAYCLMDNHYHLLMEVRQKNLSLIMHKINHRYSIYFNRKYDRVGHLWQGRYKSWFVQDERYLHTLTHYIEQNPIRAGITKAIGDFPWASATTTRSNLTDDEIQSLNRFHQTKLINVDGHVTATKKLSLTRHFINNNRDKSILNAIKDGYRQSKIAKYLNLSDVAISKILKTETSKECLFNKLRDKGIFWSYDKNISYDDINDALFIEHTLKYGDFDDLILIFDYFGKLQVRAVWEKYLLSDQRYIKLNLLIARVFLGMDVESGYFKEVENARYTKLRLLAS